MIETVIIYLLISYKYIIYFLFLRTLHALQLIIYIFVKYNGVQAVNISVIIVCK